MANGDGSEVGVAAGAPGVPVPVAGADRELLVAVLPRFDAATRFAAERVLMQGTPAEEVAAALGVSTWAVARKLARFLAVARGPLTLALLAAAVAGCGGGPAQGQAANAPKPSIPEVQLAPAGVPAAREAARAEPAAVSPAEPRAQPPPSAREIDLEYSSGLAEPPQTQALAAPAPWRPAAEAEAGASLAIADVWPDKGPASGGARVEIRGQDLRVAQVVFGVTPARILERSAERVVVEAPPGADGRVAIALTNDDGRYAVVADAFRYYR